MYNHNEKILNIIISEMYFCGEKENISFFIMKGEKNIVFKNTLRYNDSNPFTEEI